MSKSTEDLKAGFAGESQANRRYLAFAKRAEEEGHPQAAKLFRAAAHAETVHALNHLKALGEIKSTSENLEAAAQGENYEAVTMYPGFVRDAEADGNRQALRSFQYALAVEKVHESLYRKAIETLGKETSNEDYYVCPICGYTHYGSAPEKCPVCATPGAKFERIS
jgi:rubrerythrin